MGQRITGTPTVLVVDDEVFIRLVAIDLLEESGFATLEAGDAAEALELLEERGDIDVVFSDVRMPGWIDGIGLARTIAERWPHIPMILTSGHSNAAEIPPPAQFLPKPYRGTHLIERITALVA